MCECVKAPDAACSKAASSAGIGNVVTFTTSLLIRSCAQKTITHDGGRLQNSPTPGLHSPLQLSWQVPPLSDRETRQHHTSLIFLIEKINNKQLLVNFPDSCCRRTLM